MNILELGKLIPNGISFFESEGGRVYPNQIKVLTENGLLFNSGGMDIVFRHNNGTVYLNVDMWLHNSVVGKFRNAFLGETIIETKKKLKSEEYLLAKFV